MTETHTDTIEPRGKYRWKVKADKIAAGLCRDCSKPRGEDGTADRCAGCAEKRRQYQQAYRARLAKKDEAGALAGALGDTAPRVPAPLLTAPEVNTIALGVGGKRLQLDIARSAEPSPSVDPDRPWGPDHWSAVLSVRTKDHKRQGALAVVVTAGPAFEGRPPRLAELLALLLQDAADAELPFPAWCAAVGMSADSIRAKNNHGLAQRRARALARLLGPFRKDIRKRILGTPKKTKAAR